VAYSFSLRNLEEMMAERGFELDHPSVHRWVIKLVPLFEKAFQKRKRPVDKNWRWMKPTSRCAASGNTYRAVDKAGNTVDFLLRAHSDKAAARRYFDKSIDRNATSKTLTIEESGANLAALSGHQR
jgi:transposase-like protein